MRIGCRGLLESRVLAQNRLLHPAQVRPRLDPQLPGEQIARPAVCGQRVALPSGLVQGQHELPVERLVIRIAYDQRLQFPDQVLRPAELQVSVDPPFQHDQALVGEPPGGGPGERRVRHVGESLTAPQGQRRAEHG